MLRWAREQAACTLEDAAKIARRPAKEVEDWETPGTDIFPTVRQAQKLANAYDIPFALLYADGPTPDPESDPLPEFRGVDPDLGRIRPHSRQLRRMVRQAQDRQAFIVELLEADGRSPLSWVGSAAPDSDPESLGNQIRGALGVNAGPPYPRDKERTLDWWVERVEDLGAFVLRYRPDGNRYWAFEPDEARGLSLCHPLAPFVVLNSRDAPAGRIFTLMHELAHIYFGECGIDDLGDERSLPADRRYIEQRCNQVAAAILMPAVQFQNEWNAGPSDIYHKVRDVADKFGVSRQAVAVRAMSDAIGLITADEFGAIHGYLASEYGEFRESRSSSGSGGGMAVPVRVLKEYGPRFVGIVCDARADGRLSLLDTAEALGARVGDVEAIQRRLA